MDTLAFAVCFYVVFLFSVTLHEAAHAWTSRLLGDPTAYLGGQVTLDPRPHIRREPVGMVLLPILGLFLWGWPFGFASAPYDPMWARRHPARAGWMAAAGPLANLLLVVLSAVIIALLVRSGFLVAPEGIQFGRVADPAEETRLAFAVSTILGVTLSLNLLLVILNMIPFPPLDGSAVINILLGDKLARRYQEFLWKSPWLAFLGLLIAWNFIDVLFLPPFFWIIHLIHAGVFYG